MTPEEQKALSIKCGAAVNCDANDTISVELTLEELSDYTAAVEAKRDDEVAELTRKLAEYQAVFHKMASAIRPNGLSDSDKLELIDLLSKERERCAKECDKAARLYRIMKGSNDPVGVQTSDEECEELAYCCEINARFIRELK